MNPIDYLKTLSLNPKQYLVVGSALLSVKGIKSLNDIDLLVHPDLFVELQNRGWKEEIVNNGDQNWTRLSYDICEAFLEFREKSFGEWVSDSSLLEVVDGISFLKLEEVLRVKKSWHREKDITDIKAIENYLNKNN
tara:strand:+ start:59 stop:466 length:408 start_codon:yes stop_codon:yes gene_type:complete